MSELSPTATLRDTPRTDTAASLIKFAVVGEPYELVTAEFARVLERELAHMAGLLAAQLRYNAENPAITPSATAFTEPEWKMDSAPLHWPYSEREAWKSGYYAAMKAFQKAQSGQ